MVRNLKFITSEKGRKPTLYFEDEGLLGRLRQQHRDGPKKQNGDRRIRLFVDDPQADDIAARFEERYLNAISEDGRNTIEELRQPRDGSTLVELILDNDIQNPYIENVHVSGGRVSTDVSGFSNREIKAIRQQIRRSEKRIRKRKRREKKRKEMWVKKPQINRLPIPGPSMRPDKKNHHT